MALVEAGSGLAFLSFFFFQPIYKLLPSQIPLPLWYLSQPLSSILIRMKMQTTHFSAPLVRSASTVSCQQWKAGSWNVIYFFESHSRVSTIGAHFTPKTLRENSFSSGYSWIYLFLTHTMKPQFACRLRGLCFLFCALSISPRLWRNSCRHLRSLQVLLHGELFPSELNCLMISQSPFVCFRFRRVKN